MEFPPSFPRGVIVTYLEGEEAVVDGGNKNPSNHPTALLVTLKILPKFHFLRLNNGAAQVKTTQFGKKK